MLRGKSKEVNIFSMSALDLFASAMGAFILVTIILFPYYMKNSEALRQVEQARDELKKASNEKDRLKNELNSMVRHALLGISSKARSFVVVVDMSGSMKDYNEIMLKTVTKILQPMGQDTKVGVFGFQGDDKKPMYSYWHGDMEIREMSDKNKSAADTYLKSMAKSYQGGTPTLQALIKALGYPVEGVILLTDGSPNSVSIAISKSDNKAAKQAVDHIINSVVEKNKMKKEIHTVAIGKYGENHWLTKFLQDLSTRNNGGFIGVSNINI